MIEDKFSFVVLVIDTAYDIMLPLWIFLVMGAVAATLIERFDLNRYQPTNVFVGAFVGILSPLSTINLLQVLKRGKGGTAMVFSSLLANPILLAMIYANLGVKPMLLYTCIVFFIGVVIGNIISFKPEFDSHPTEKKEYSIFYCFWVHLSYAGFYIILGAIVAAIMRTTIAYTMYLNQILKVISSIWVFNALFVLLAGPLYSCGGSWIPILKELGSLGMGISSLLGFILFGQATRPGHLSALNDAFSKRDILIFVSFTGFISLVVGVLLKNYIGIYMEL